MILQPFLIAVFELLEEYRSKDGRVDTEAIILSVRKTHPDIEPERIKRVVMDEVFARRLVTREQRTGEGQPRANN